MTDSRRMFFKWTLYVVTLLLTAVFQTVVMGSWKIFGVHPNIFPVLVAVVALVEGPYGGAAFGFATGVVCDAFMNPAEGFFMIIFMITGLFLGAAGEYLFKRNIFTALLFSLASMAIENVLFFTFFVLLPGKASIYALWTVALPEILFSTLFMPVIYALIKYISKKLTRKKESIYPL